MGIKTLKILSTIPIALANFYFPNIHQNNQRYVFSMRRSKVPRVKKTVETKKILDWNNNIVSFRFFFNRNLFWFE